jgi:hypothetical protein
MEVFRFLQQCGWGLHYGMCHCVTGYLVPEIARKGSFLETSGTKYPVICHIPEGQIPQSKEHEV